MISELEASYCVDQDRLFSTGFSYGGIMSDTLACQMADVFRAIAPMAGTVFGGSCNRANPIAAWIEHGEDDTVLPPDGGVAMRDILLEANHCTSTSQPVDPSPCVAYDGCDPGYPVVWCPVPGEGQAIPSFGGSAIAAFFQQF
jgi:polyhydroxybutyrate depolymerase